MAGLGHEVVEDDEDHGTGSKRQGIRKNRLRQGDGPGTKDASDGLDHAAELAVPASVVLPKIDIPLIPINDRLVTPVGAYDRLYGYIGGSFSAVSTRLISRVGSFFSIFRDLREI